LLTGQINLENPDRNYRLSNIELTAGDDGMLLSRADKGIVNDKKIKNVKYVV